MKALVIKCEKVDFSIYENYFTIYPRDGSQKQAAFETAKQDSDSDDEKDPNCYELLEEDPDNLKEIYTYNNEHNECHKDNLSSDDNHIHFQFKNKISLSKFKEILMLFIQDKAISAQEFETSLQAFASYTIKNKSEEDTVEDNPNQSDNEDTPSEKNEIIQNKAAKPQKPNTSGKSDFQLFPSMSPTPLTQQRKQNDNNKPNVCNIM